MNKDNAKVALYADIKGNDQSDEWMWQHCYTHFRNKRGLILTDEDYDILCLHLTMYLAIGGMYRASSFLYQNSYKIHKQAIECLLDEKFDVLVAISIEELTQPKNVVLLFELVEELNKIYRKIRKETYQKQQKKNPQSNVSVYLISKIILGTLGCLPAYGPQFKKGLSIYGVHPFQFNKNSLEALLGYVVKYKAQLTDVKSNLAIMDFHATDMKVIDSYFWHVGNLSITEKKDIK